MNAGSGKNLNWFWKKWFYDSGIPDLAIARVAERGFLKVIEIKAVGSKPVPVDLTISFADGSKTTLHQSVRVWEKGNTSYTFQFADKRKIAKVELGSVHVPDANKKDNNWPLQKP